MWKKYDIIANALIYRNYRTKTGVFVMKPIHMSGILRFCWTTKWILIYISIKFYSLHLCWNGFGLSPVSIALSASKVIYSLIQNLKYTSNINCNYGPEWQIAHRIEPLLNETEFVLKQKYFQKETSLNLRRERLQISRDQYFALYKEPRYSQLRRTYIHTY